jgi:hypothetical protein
MKPEHYKPAPLGFSGSIINSLWLTNAPAYDFFMIVCGPIPLSERMARPDAALTIAADDAIARE